MISIKQISLFVFSITILIGSVSLIAQEKVVVTEPVLSLPDQIALANLPELTQDYSFNKVTLPYALDNADQPYFRPLFEQITIECGQYSGIAFNFCYEMNYSRNTPANIPENQYPTHYTFNFMNGGYGWQGVSYLHSFEIATANGHPNAEDYGGINQSGSSMWISGYNKYYRGMSNKIDEVYQIKAGTPEGLDILKNWLHNHMVGDSIGGIASFYSPNPWNPTTLPPETPEGGKHVITAFAGSIGHSSTITGYNDSIRYDYNQDGQYTNDIDINDDGIVDMKDWEIGGLLFTDSYNGGINYADSGFCYMMYKTLAEEGNNGGIWNHAVHVVTIKKDYEPLLAYKIKLRHSCRNTLKVMVGVSSDPDATTPDHTLSFPLFDYQGGCQYMQGGWEAAAISLEFGLDVTPMLAHINMNGPNRFFLLVDENDPPGYGSGLIEEFSLMNYTGNIEIQYPNSNVPLVHNGLTTISLSTTISYDKLEITDTGLPVALTNEPYLHQLEAEGGTAPYSWKMARHYDITATTNQFPTNNGISIIMADTLHGMAMQVLDFPFPFYGDTFDTVWVHSDGFIMFDPQTYPWPYNHDQHLLLRKIRAIAPYLNLGLFFSSFEDNEISYEGSEDYATFFWNMSAPKPDMDDIEFAMKLFPSGKIEFFYSDENIFLDPYWASGISNGDDLNYYITDQQIKELFPSESKITFLPKPFPVELSLSENGLLSGTTTQNYEGEIVDFVVKDVNNLTIRKEMPFYSYVAAVDENILLGKDGLIIFPNPSNGIINLEFTLKEKGKVILNLLGQNGEYVKRLIEMNLSGGKQNFSFDVRGKTNIPPGIYLLQLKVDGHISSTKKIVFLD